MTQRFSLTPFTLSDTSQSIRCRFHSQSNTMNPDQYTLAMPPGLPRLVGITVFAALLLLAPRLSIAASPAPNPPVFAQATQLIEKGDPESAATALRRFLATSPRPEHRDDAYLLLGAALYHMKDYPEAVKYLTQLQQEFPKSEVLERGSLLLARTHAAMGNPDLALPLLAHVRTTTQDAGTKHETLKLTANAFVQKKDYTRAIRTLLETMEDGSDEQTADLRAQVREMITEKLDTKGLIRVRESYPHSFPGDLASLRLIDHYVARREDHLAERESRNFLADFPDHPQTSKVMDSLALLNDRLKANHYLVAAILPLSGRLKPFANDVLEGIQLAIEETREQIGAPSIGLIVKDQDANRHGFLDDLSLLLLEDTPVAVIGPLLSKNLPVMAEMAQKTRIPLITPTATLPDIRRLGSYLFSTSLTYDMQTERIVTYAMNQQGYRRFCILYPDTIYGRQLARLFAQKVRERNGEIISIESFKEGDTDFSAPITQLKDEDLKKYGLAVPITASGSTSKNAARNDKRLLYTPGFDAMFIPSRSSDIGLIATQLAFHDIRVPLLGTNGWNTPDFLRTADRTVEGATFVDGFFADSPSPVVKDFVQRHQKRFQSTPSLFTMQGYDAARVIIEGIRNGATSGEALQEFLATQQRLPSLAGPASFGPDGTLHHPLFLLQVKQGKFVQLD